MLVVVKKSRPSLETLSEQGIKAIYGNSVNPQLLCDREIDNCMMHILKLDSLSEKDKVAMAHSRSSIMAAAQTQKPTIKAEDKAPPDYALLIRLPNLITFALLRA